MLAFRLDVETMAGDAHSGSVGVLPSASWRMVEAINAIRSIEGEVMLPGFLDAVLAPSDAARLDPWRLRFDAPGGGITSYRVPWDYPDTMASTEAPRSSYCPTRQEIEDARRVFRERESRDLFYWVALELLRLADEGKTSVTRSQALAVVLGTWNRSFYRFHPPDRAAPLDVELRRLLRRHHRALDTRHTRSIEDFRRTSAQETRCVLRMFHDFEELLGPVGAAKTLHLLCPQYFPIWDRGIARAYGVGLRPRTRGGNAERYLRFMEISQDQARSLGGHAALDTNPLKVLDEYNYCRYTQGWV